MDSLLLPLSLILLDFTIFFEHILNICQFFRLSYNNLKHTLNVCTAYTLELKMGNFPIYRFDFVNFLDIYLSIAQ